MKTLAKWVAIMGLALVPIASAQAQTPQDSNATAQAQTPQDSNQARGAATSRGGAYAAYPGYGVYRGRLRQPQNPWADSYGYAPLDWRYGH